MAKQILLFYLVLVFIILTGMRKPPQKTNNPHGQSIGECGECHTTDNWQVDAQKIKFNHRRTGFALVGAHASQECTDCHESLVFANIGTACADCHTDIHKGELGKECSSCHNSVTWENRQEIFHQHRNTRFPLNGTHALVDCELCHSNQQYNTYKNTPVECNICHAQDYITAQNPNHQRAGFPLECLICHRSNAYSWSEADFDHSLFLLTGAHQRASCNSCHQERFAGTQRECTGCHKAEFDGTSNPNHLQFGFQTTCETCHNTERWSETNFDHLIASGFELVGIHRTSDCLRCHINNQATGLPRECIGCHESDYRNAKDPNHAAADFPHDCIVCHSQNAWQPADFDHNTTAFPLTGAHQAVLCSNCHANNIYIGTPTNCYDCHQSDFQRVTDPNHILNNFDHNCTTCHSTSAWIPATFDHNKTSFPLTGAHQAVLCSNCHANNIYIGTPTNCYACHQKEYDQTTDPNHKAAQFPQDCQNCHNTSNWNQTTFDHDSQYFPIYSGAHRGEWSRCAECHVNSSNYQVFECINCHEHTKSETDSDHREVGDYQYKSTACYDCHPRGKADD